RRSNGEQPDPAGCALPPGAGQPRRNRRLRRRSRNEARAARPGGGTAGTAGVRSVTDPAWQPAPDDRPLLLGRWEALLSRVMADAPAGLIGRYGRGLLA